MKNRKRGSGGRTGGTRSTGPGRAVVFVEIRRHSGSVENRSQWLQVSGSGSSQASHQPVWGPESTRASLEETKRTRGSMARAESRCSDEEMR